MNMNTTLLDCGLMLLVNAVSTLRLSNGEEASPYTFDQLSIVNGSDHFQTLPEEVILHVFQLLEPFDLLYAAQVTSYSFTKLVSS